jgi:hypothetical protein
MCLILWIWSWFADAFGVLDEDDDGFVADLELLHDTVTSVTTTATQTLVTFHVLGCCVIRVSSSGSAMDGSVTAQVRVD